MRFASRRSYTAGNPSGAAPLGSPAAGTPAAVPDPLIVLCGCLATGIVVGRFLGGPLAAYLVGGMVLTALAACCLARKQTRAASLLVALGFCAAGAALEIAPPDRTITAGARLKRFYDEKLIGSGDPIEVTGVLARAAEPAPDGIHLRLRIEKFRFKEREQRARGTLWLFAPTTDETARARYDALTLNYGARLRVMTALRRADEFRNPGVPQFLELLEQRDVDAVGAIKSPLLVERLEDEPVFPPLKLLGEWRSRLLFEFDRVFSRQTAGILKAALLGNPYYISRETAERFRQGGTFHVLVISGMHITVIGGLALLLAKRLTTRRTWQFAGAVILLWSYTLMVGAEVSVVRAALMFTFVALGPVLFRRARTLNALGGAALMLLVWRPGELFDPAFQLTFFSVLAIVVAAWPVLAKLKEAGAWRLTEETPYPPRGPRWLVSMGELLFWDERAWRAEIGRASYSYNLFKTTWAARLGRYRLQRLARYTVAGLIVSASVQAGLLPLFVLYFHRVSFASLLLNLWVGLMMSLLTLLAVVGLIIAQASQAAAVPVVWLAEQASWLMIYGGDLMMDSHAASVRPAEYSGWMSLVYAIYYLPLIPLLHALSRFHPLDLPPLPTASRRSKDADGWHFSSIGRYKLLGAAAAFLLLGGCLVMHPFSRGRPDGRLRIDFLDVGQGDAALVTMPDGVTLLVDGGGRPRYAAASGDGGDAEDEEEPFEPDVAGVGERVVSEHLWWRGLSRVDYLLATHAHADHIDGLTEVAGNFRVRAALVGRAPQADDSYRKFAAQLKREGVPVELIGGGDRLRFGRVAIDVLWPPPLLRLAGEEAGDAPSGNNDSVVLRVEYGGRVVLLTGDIEQRAEEQMVAAAAGEEDGQLRCDVLKVAHHGSRTSSIAEFVRQTRARLAVISVGRSSVFGHPHQEVVERLRASGAEVMTTGERGMITVSTDGQDLRVETFIQDD